VTLREPTLKMMLLSLDQGRWLEKEAERTGIAEAELIRQAIERLQAGPPAEFPWEQLGQRRRPFAYWLQQGIDWPPREDVQKLVRIERRMLRWLNQESRRLGVSHRELLCEAIKRFQAGPPARLPSNRSSLWRRKDWLYTVTASESLARKWERYRLRQLDS